MRLVAPAKPLAELLEVEWELQVIGKKTNPGLARQLGFLCYHTLRSRGSEAGWPDWTLVRERVLFLELKREKTKLSEAQRHWQRALLNAGAETYVARPRDLEAIGHVLSFRANPLDPNLNAYTGAAQVAVAAATELRESLRREIA